MASLVGTIPSDFSQLSVSSWFNIERLPSVSDPDLGNIFSIAPVSNPYGGARAFIGSDGSVTAQRTTDGIGDIGFICISAPLIQANQWYHALFCCDATGTKTSYYNAYYSSWELGGPALFKIVINAASRNVDTAYPNPRQFGNTTVFGSGYSGPHITPTNYTLTTINDLNPGTPNIWLQFAAKPAWWPYTITAISVAGLHPGTYALGWDATILSGILYLSTDVDAPIPAGTSVDFTVSVPDGGAKVDSADWNVGRSGSKFTLGGDDFKIRYGDFQAWLGLYIDPTNAANFSKFVRIQGGKGYPASTGISAAAFGTQSVLFKGKASDSSFYFNRGTMGAFSKVGTISDFTPSPSY